jgi:two-component system sensor histidine kinase MtrB
VLQDTDIATAVTTCLHARDWADVVSDVPDELSVRLDRRSLDIIVANLVGNAVRHGEAPGHRARQRRAGRSRPQGARGRGS